ncbi:MAG: hypothetical protein HY075_11875 [Deltaproteobacteria bacterium]|nr:hypothetical protein [Deltaproteobacteria bacterium]
MRSVVLALILALSSSACGYGFRSKSNPWANRGVRKVYIPMLINNSLKAGIEVPFTSAFVKEFSRGNRLRVVTDESDADARVVGTITSFDSEINSFTSVPQLAPNDVGAQALSDMVVASEYVAKANIQVQLVAKGGAVLWMQVFNRPKIYPAGNRFGLQGSTSALINASQEALALDNIAGFIASDVYDTMLEAF